MKHFVIVGNSAAGIASVEAIRAKDKTSKVTIISDEAYPAYCRCLISYYLAGEVKEDKLIYRSENFYKENNITLILQQKAERVDVKKNRVILTDKTHIEYDSLLIATGSRAKFPQLPGIRKHNVFGLRTLKDAKGIDGQIPVVQTVAVIGGGLIGLKAAYALKKRKLDVKVIVKSEHILSQMLDEVAAQIVQNRLAENGMEIITATDVSEIIGNGDIKAVKLETGKVIGCSLVIVAKGVEANLDLVKDTAIEKTQGIRVNKYLETTIPNIFAAGDVCETFDLTLGQPTQNALWPLAIEQGRIAGMNMAGEKISYPGSVGMNSIEFFGLPIISLGLYKTNREGDYEVISSIDLKANRYKKLILKDNRLVGAVLVGEIQNSGVLLRLIRDQLDLSQLKDRLASENFNYADIIRLLPQEDKVYV